MAGVQIIGDFKRLKRVIRKLDLSSSELTAVNRQIGQVIKEGTIERFQSEKSPEGEKWVPLAESTLIARARKRSNKLKTKKGEYTKRARTIMANAKPLKDTGKLMSSLSVKANKQGVAVGTNAVQAGLMQMGGTAGRGRKVKVPARPFLGMSDEEKQDIQNLLIDFIEEKIK